MSNTNCTGQHLMPPLPYTRPLVMFLADQETTEFAKSVPSGNVSSISKKGSSTILSPSTVINLSVSLCLAHSLCALSNPFTPSTLFANGNLLIISAQCSSLLGSS